MPRAPQITDPESQTSTGRSLAAPRALQTGSKAFSCCQIPLLGFLGSFSQGFSPRSRAPSTRTVLPAAAGDSAGATKTGMGKNRKTPKKNLNVGNFSFIFFLQRMIPCSKRNPSLAGLELSRLCSPLQPSQPAPSSLQAPGFGLGAAGSLEVCGGHVGGLPRAKADGSGFTSCFPAGKCH